MNQQTFCERFGIDPDYGVDLGYNIITYCWYGVVSVDPNFYNRDPWHYKSVAAIFRIKQRYTTDNPNPFFNAKPV